MMLLVVWVLARLIGGGIPPLAPYRGTGQARGYDGGIPCVRFAPRPLALREGEGCYDGWPV